MNDGQDGTAAIIRTCGPDDLLDFVNPSAQIRPFAPALNFPAAADDNDQPIEACTEYRLSPQKSYLAMETTVENMGAVPLKLFVGDWMNGGGELEQWFAPGAGFGAGLFGELQSLAFVGYGEAQGIDYSYVSIPTQEVQAPTDVVEKSNFFNTSGVSVILNNMDIIQAVAVGALPPFTVPAGGTRSYHALLRRRRRLGQQRHRHPQRGARHRRGHARGLRHRRRRARRRARASPSASRSIW